MHTVPRNLEAEVQEASDAHHIAFDNHLPSRQPRPYLHRLLYSINNHARPLQVHCDSGTYEL
jgi:hypothetical protein